MTTFTTDTHYPLATDLAGATRTYRQGAWTVRARKLPISRAGSIAAMEKRLGIPVPEMIFGDNAVEVLHGPSGWGIRFGAEEALDLVDKTGENRLQVAHAKDWAKTRDTSAAAGIGDVRPYDWSYSTVYRGTEMTTTTTTTTTTPKAEEESKTEAKDEKKDEKTDEKKDEKEKEKEEAKKTETEVEQKQTNDTATPATHHHHLLPSPNTPLPMDLLRRRDPILFHDSVILYESELDDNGMSLLRVKVRVMPQCLLVLARFYLRVDRVVVRVRDTRVYVDFRTDTVLRQYTAREAPEDDVRRQLMLRWHTAHELAGALRDADEVAPLVAVVEETMEKVELGVGRGEGVKV